jgi:hypothetical protein
MRIVSPGLEFKQKIIKMLALFASLLLLSPQLSVYSRQIGDGAFLVGMVSAVKFKSA